MASSQVQMASAFFGCVLGDHNWRHRHKKRESNNNVRAEKQASFENNLKVFVRDHLQSCIALSGSGDSESSSDENPKNEVDDREKNHHNLRPFSRKYEESQSEDESSSMSRKQLRVADRWATRQAREMITTTERQTHEAELLALSNSHPVSTVASTFKAESPRATEYPGAPSESSVDLPNRHTSSLVQMWRGIEAESKVTSGNHGSFSSNSTVCSDGRLNSGTSNTDNASSVEDPSPCSDVCDSEDERYETPMAHEESFVDWGSEQNTPRERFSSSQRRGVSDVGESERLRVADIIRRLTSRKPIKTRSSSSSYETDREQPVVIDPVPEQGQQRGFVNAGKNPRVRGRQAIMDLFLQMERERQRELNELVERRAVSRFPQRGRLQSMLKLRFLKREVADRGQHRPPSAASKLGGFQQGTSIMALRRKFSLNRHAVEVHGEESGDDSKSHTQLPNNTTYSEHSSTSSQLMNEEAHHQLVARIEQESTPPVHHSMPSTTKDLCEEAGQNSDRAWQGKSLVVSDPVPEGSINTATASWDSEGTGVTEEPEPDAQQLVGSSTDGTWLRDVSHPQRDWRRGSVQSWYQDLLVNNSEDGERNVVTDERESGMQQQLAGSTNGTWLGDVSCSQIDWRHSRQARYKDGFDNNYENKERNVVTAEQESDIQQLAGSTDRTWLADGACLQTDWRGQQSWYQNVLENNSEDGEENVETNEPDPDTESNEESTGIWLGNASRPHRDWKCSRQEWYHEMLENSSDNGEIRELLQRRSVSNFLASDLRETIDKMIQSCIQRQSHYSEHEGEEENLLEQSYPSASDASDYFATASFNQPLSTLNNLPLPSQQRSQDHEVTDNYDQVASTSLQSPPSHCQDNMQPTINHSSLEMDLISDLRGHMVQLHNEIYELRKSMESCMGMQNKLQHNIKKEVSAAIYHSVHGEATELFNWVPTRKGKCCICYEMQVDSLLYRCGHMCTCFKCAHELQWSSGRCPICRAPILDVVRAYSNS